MDEEYKEKRTEKNRLTYRNLRWSGLSHDKTMEFVPQYYKKKFLMDVEDLVNKKSYKRRKLFLDILVWTPAAFYIIPFVYTLNFRMNREWLLLNGIVVGTEMAVILFLIF